MVVVTIKGEEKLFAAIARFPEMASKNLRVALKEGLLVIKYYSSKNHKYKAKTGAADSAYKIVTTKGGLVSELQLDPSKKAPYINILHTGSKPHIIKPKNKKALRFVMGGKTVMVPANPHNVPAWMIASGLIGSQAKGIIWSKKGYVNHPGTKKDEFLYRARDEKHGEVMKILNDAIKTTIKQAGF